MKKMISFFLLFVFLIEGTFTLASAASSDAFLEGISIRPKHEEALPGDDSLYYAYVSLGEQFKTDITQYNTTVENEVSNVRIEVRKPDDVSVSGDKEYDLNVGMNTINITASKGGTSRTYTINIEREMSEKDNNDIWYFKISSNLGSLDQQISPSFNSSITNYTLNVNSNINTIYVSAIPVNGEAKLEFNNPYKLVGGQNTVKLVATSVSGLVKEYVINVNRTKSSNSSLAELKINDDNILKYDVINYTQNVSYDVGFINLTAKLCDSNSKVTGMGKHFLKVGNNSIKVTVTAENGTKTDYNLTVVRNKPSANLQYVELENDICGVQNNTASFNVNYSTTSVNIKGIPVDKSAKVTGNGTRNLKVGANKFYLTVKAANGTTKKCTVAINREKYKKPRKVYLVVVEE